MPQPPARDREERRSPRPREDSEPGLLQMIEEVLDLSAGVGIMLLPLMILAVPAIILVAVPAVLLLVVLAVPVALGAAVVVPAYLLIRSVRRRRAGRSGPAGLASSAGWPSGTATEAPPPRSA